MLEWGQLKNGFMIALGALIIINLVCIGYMYQTSKIIVGVLKTYKSEMENKVSKFEGLLADIEVVKQAVGWKTYEAGLEYCFGSKQYVADGPFSFVTEGGSGCLIHEFTKLNELMHSLEVAYFDGRFQPFMYKVKKEFLDGLQPQEMNELKSTVKSLLEKVK